MSVANTGLPPAHPTDFIPVTGFKSRLNPDGIQVVIFPGRAGWYAIHTQYRTPSKDNPAIVFSDVIGPYPTPNDPALHAGVSVDHWGTNHTLYKFSMIDGVVPVELVELYIGFQIRFVDILQTGARIQ